MIGKGKLIYDLSGDRVKAFNINVNPAGVLPAI